MRLNRFSFPINNVARYVCFSGENQRFCRVNAVGERGCDFGAMKYWGLDKKFPG